MTKDQCPSRSGARPILASGDCIDSHQDSNPSKYRAIRDSDWPHPELRRRCSRSKPSTESGGAIMSEFLTLAQAARECPVEVTPHSVWRWARRGLKSRSGEVVRLEHVRAGRRVLIPRDALARFFEAVAFADMRSTDSAPPERRDRLGNGPRRSAARAAAYERAMRELGADD